MSGAARLIVTHRGENRLVVVLGVVKGFEETVVVCECGISTGLVEELGGVVVVLDSHHVLKRVEINVGWVTSGNINELF